MEFSHYEVEEHSVGNFMYKVYAWMSLALAVTAGVAYYVSTVPAIYQAIHTNMFLLIGLFLVQLLLVIGLSAAIFKMNFATALIGFLIYAATLGLTLSIIFKLYTAVSIYATFLVTAGMFGATALYGYFTRSDLSSIGSMSIMALIGLIIAGLVNLWLQNPMFDLIVSGIGVIVFTLLTAFDVQRIKQLAQQFLVMQPHAMANIAIMGALMLYLDFINLFLYLLRFMGKGKEE